MNKRHFVELLTVLRSLKPSCDAVFFSRLVSHLAEFCKKSNPQFDEIRFRAYIDGKCGPSGSRLKTKKSTHTKLPTMDTK